MKAVGAEGEGTSSSTSREKASGWRSYLFYGTTRGVSEGLLSLRGLVLAALLTPAGFGVWTLFRIAGRYAAMAELGVRRGLEFKIARGGSPGAVRDAPEVRQYGHATLGYLLMVFSSIAVISFAGSFVVEDPTARFAMRVFSVAILVERVWHYALTYLRSSGDLRSFAALELLNAALHLALAGAGALAWGLHGALAGFATAWAISAVLLARRVPFVPALSLGALRQLMEVGFPLALTMAASGVLVTVDRLVVVAYGGTGLLGQYAFAAAIASAAGTLAWVVRTVVFPEIYRGSAERGVDTAVRRLFDRTILPFAYLYPPLLGLAALGIGPSVALLFPEYIDAVAPARLFIFVGAAAGFSGLGSLGIVAASRQRLLPWLAASGLVLNVGLSVVALELGAGLEGVAASTLFSRAAYGASVLGLVAVAAGIPGVRRLVARTVVPLTYCALAVYGIGLLFPAPRWIDALASAGLYCALLLPLGLVLVRWSRDRGAAFRRPG